MNTPIGIFDSGVGGTSIWKEITGLLPSEATVYLADSRNAPYGNQSKEAILALAVKNTELLLSYGCKLIVVACNTATTNAIGFLRKTYPVPFVGIEPAIKPAALQTKTRKVGVLATKGTLSSTLFHNTAKLHASGITVIEREGKGLVELIETGRQQAEATRKLLKEYLQPMLEAGIDCLVLGCTHYPYLVPTIKTILPEHITIIDSGEAVARQTMALLQEHNLAAPPSTIPKHRFYSNANVAVLSSFVQHPTIQVSFLDF